MYINHSSNHSKLFKSTWNHLRIPFTHHHNPQIQNQIHPPTPSLKKKKQQKYIPTKLPTHHHTQFTPRNRDEAWCPPLRSITDPRHVRSKKKKKIPRKKTVVARSLSPWPKINVAETLIGDQSRRGSVPCQTNEQRLLINLATHI